MYQKSDWEKMHHDETTDRETLIKWKPETQTFYKTKGGVDVVDELGSYYDFT